MELDEFKREFDLVYNNLASNQAAGLTPYEISVYLTKAQYTLEDALYQEYEVSEEARRKLANLVVTKELPKLTSLNSSDFVYPEYTVAFDLSEVSDLRYIINEKLKLSSSADRCVRNKIISVTPVSHDEVDRLINNPFRFNNSRAFRLDTSKSSAPYIEILAKDKNIAYYKIRYVKTPPPIILEDISPDSIEGVSTASPCMMNEVLHRQIVEIAAKMAYQDYKV